MQKFMLGTNFLGQATPMKITPAKICTNERLAAVITVGYPQPRKFIPQNIVTTKISTSMVLVPT